MRYEVRLPSLGEDEDAVRGGTVAIWHIQTGERIQEDDDLVEVNTDKAAFVVPAPKSGILIERCVEEGGFVGVGDILCIIET